MAKNISFTDIRSVALIITEDGGGNLVGLLQCSMIGGNDGLVRTIALPLTAGEQTAIKQRIVQKVIELRQQEGV